MNVKSCSFFQDLMVADEKLLSLGFWALQVYRFGHIRYGLKNRVVRFLLGVIHLFLSKVCEIAFGITIGVSAKIGKKLRIEHCGCIVIHGNAVIGDNCIIRQGVTIGNKRLDESDKAPIIGDNVNIGAGAKILGGVKVGNNASIGANSVVVKDVVENTTVVGVPAREIIYGK